MDCSHKAPPQISGGCVSPCGAWLPISAGQNSELWEDGKKVGGRQEAALQFPRPGPGQWELWRALGAWVGPLSCPLPSPGPGCVEQDGMIGFPRAMSRPGTGGTSPLSLFPHPELSHLSPHLGANAEGNNHQGWAGRAAHPGYFLETGKRDAG